MILITGAGGKTGRALVKALSDFEFIRALVHREEQGSVLKSLGAEKTVVGDIGDEFVLRSAMEAVRVVYHICPNMSPDERVIGKLVIDTAREVGVEHFIYHSVLHPQTEKMNHHWQKLRVEEMIFGTSLGELEDVPVPRTRKGFQSQLFERYRRRQAELDESICQMFVQGVSTEKVGQIVETLSGSHPSPSTVSRVFHTLEEEFATWKKRPLQGHYLYLIVDGTYFSVIYEGAGQKMPILAVIGIDPAGKREVLGFSTGDRENQSAWEALLTDCKDRGLQTVDLWISDGGKAMISRDCPLRSCNRHPICKIFWQAGKVSLKKVFCAFRILFNRNLVLLTWKMWPKLPKLF